MNLSFPWFLLFKFLRKVKVLPPNWFRIPLRGTKTEILTNHLLHVKNKEVALGESPGPGISSINNAIIYNRIWVINNVLSIIRKIAAPGNWLLIRNMRTVKFLHLWNQCEWEKSVHEKEIYNEIRYWNQSYMLIKSILSVNDLRSLTSLELKERKAKWNGEWSIEPISHNYTIIVIRY